MAPALAPSQLVRWPARWAHSLARWVDFYFVPELASGDHSKAMWLRADAERHDSAAGAFCSSRLAAGLSLENTSQVGCAADTRQAQLWIPRGSCVGPVPPACCPSGCSAQMCCWRPVLVRYSSHCCAIVDVTSGFDPRRVSSPGCDQPGGKLLVQRCAVPTRTRSDDDGMR